MRKIVFYSILIFIFSCFTGFFYGKIWKSNNDKMTQNISNSLSKENVQETYSEEEKLSFDSNFTIKKYYDECGHLDISNSKIPDELINLSKEDVENLYEEMEVEEFSKNNIILSEEINGVCDNHYVLKLNDDNVEVYHLESDGEETLYKSTNISKDYLTKGDIENLEEGIYIYGKENINSAIEDFE